MVYGLLKVSYMSAHDGLKHSVLGMQVHSIEDWQQQVHSYIAKFMDEYGFFSFNLLDGPDDNFTDMEELMKKISFTTITKEEFDILATYLGTKQNPSNSSFEIGSINLKKFYCIL